jgi:hypothetical protein
MTKIEQAMEYQKKSNRTMSISTVLRRMRAGWSADAIINTPVQVKPPKNHIYKKPNYLKMASLRGWV